MFYFKELTIRVILSFFFFFFVLSLCFVYKHLFFYFFSLPILDTTTYLIYTNPIEFVTSYMLMILIVSFCFYTIYFIWQLLDFIKGGLYVYEYKGYRFFINNLLILIFFINFFILNTFLPHLWFSFQQFNFYLTEINNLDFFLELKVFEYFAFLQYNLLTLNSVFFLLLFFSFFEVNFFIVSKKIYCLFNILFSTLFSTPDVYSQVCFLIILQLFFEVYVFIVIIRFKFTKSISLFSKSV